jgi:hypothetical protein
MKPDDNQLIQTCSIILLSGGKYLAFEQVNDRDKDTVIDRMNLTAPNPRICSTNFLAAGGHCCWNRFYGGQGNTT